MSRVYSSRGARPSASLCQAHRSSRVISSAIGVQCDVSDEDNVAGAMRETLDWFGRLDCLVANAGTTGKQSFTDMSLGEWHRVLQVNLDGAFLCLREAARVLVGQGQGDRFFGYRPSG